MVALELKYLEVSGKITSHIKVVQFLQKVMLASEAEASFTSIVHQAIAENWTRDPFDRMIVAHARLESAHLVTSDNKISSNFDRAII